MGSFDFTSSDGTKVVGWRNDTASDSDALPVVISNGLGTPPTAWPTVIEPSSGFRVATWYYRGTGGGDRPADPSHVQVEDHVEDLLVAPLAERMARSPTWRDTTVRIQVASEPGAADLTIP